MRTTASSAKETAKPTPASSALAPSKPGQPDAAGDEVRPQTHADSVADELAAAVAADALGPEALAEVERRGPGRPRSARVDEAIIDAVLDLLAEGTTAEALSIESVAARAGVGKATIYRRWTNKESLLIDAVAAVKGGIPEVSGTTAHEQIISLLRPVARNDSTRAARITPGLIAQMQQSPQLQSCYQRIIEPRRNLLRQVLHRGVETGELRPDLDIEVVMAMLVAPMVVQNLMNWNPNLRNGDLPARILDAMWPALAAIPA